MHFSAHLIRPDVRYRTAFWAMLDEYVTAGEQARHRSVRHLAKRDFPAYVRWLTQQAVADNVASGWVPNSAYWLVDGSELIGETNLRHYLTPSLKHEGGHIGYRIRPSRRRQGYGTRILTLALREARDRGLHRVLVTCDKDNIGSRRIIEKHGGILGGEVLSHESGKEVLQFWIDI